MKIKIMSDLHTEFNNYIDYAYSGEDVLLLVGDIVEYATTSHFLRELLEKVPENVYVLMVNGNHEFYGSYFEPRPEIIEELENHFPRFKLLHNQVERFKGLVFFGGTMFTSLRETFEDPVNIVQLQMGVGDFHEIRKKESDMLWTPIDHANEFTKFVEGLEKVKKTISKNEKLIVMSHFIPKPDHCDPRFGVNQLSPYFCEDMTDHCEGVTLWVHGHGHTAFDSVHNNTRFVCNPHGYPTELARGTGYNKNKIVEV